MGKTAQASRLELAVNFAHDMIVHLEGMLGETKQPYDEASQLLSSSVSAVYSLENEAVKLRGLVSRQEEEVRHASMVHEDIQQKWKQLSEVNTSLRA
jgi:hypothetical protein